MSHTTNLQLPNYKVVQSKKTSDLVFITVEHNFPFTKPGKLSQVSNWKGITSFVFYYILVLKIFRDNLPKRYRN